MSVALAASGEELRKRVEVTYVIVISGLFPRARFQLSEGPGSQGTIAAQFNCEGTTLSGVEFELVGAGYRVSLVKRRFVSGEFPFFFS